MYTDVYAYEYTQQAHVYKCIHIWIYMYMYSDDYVHSGMSKDMYVYDCKSSRIWVYMYMYMKVYIYKLENNWSLCIWLYMYMYTNVCI